jgi:type II secretory pathway component PulK
MTSPRLHCVSRHHGTALIVAMTIIFVIAGLTVALCASMRVEAIASANQAAQIDAAAVERAAEQYALALIAVDKEDVFNEPEDSFAAVQVGDGYFWILKPQTADDNTQFGLTDESSKLNMNSASRDSLLLLPNMTENLVDALIDWRDTDENPSPSGAESPYYLGLGADAYNCKNAPLESVEELLLVKDWTTDILYGPATTGIQTAGALGNASNLTLYDLLTVYSFDTNKSSTGENRININDAANAQQVRNYLNQTLGAARGNEVADRARPTPPFSDVFDFRFRTDLTSAEFALVADRLTTTTRANVPGRVNVNTAPREVLACLPGLDQSDADALIAARSANNSTSIAWVADVLDQKSVGLGDLITTRTSTYSADIVAVSGNGRAYSHYRVVIDARSTPAIVYRRDLTSLGFPMDREILDSLRRGEGPAGTTPMNRSAF